jgi:hypothetical protein
MGRPNIIVQLPTREKVRAFREGVGDTLGVVALELEPKVFWTLGGLDALYLTLSRAERWGSRPLPPHTAALLRTTEQEQKNGMPPYVITGMVLKEDEPNTPEHGVPLLVKAVLRLANETNKGNPGTIRTVGFFEHELFASGGSPKEIAALFAKSVDL